MRIKIIADSTNDLSRELLEKYDIRRMPLTIVMGEKEHKDGVEINPLDIFEFVGAGRGNSHTSAINAAEYQSVYAEELAAGAGAILHFTISAELSSCYENAVIAARDFAHVYPIDTRSLSTGGGWLVLYAADLAARGVSAVNIKQACEAKRQLVSASFVLDTLEYMHKGGRCSGFTALSANMLKVKPCLAMHEGKLGVSKKYRGNMKKVVAHYLKDRLEGQQNIDFSRAFITHTFYDDPDLVSAAVRMTRALQPFEEVLITEAGCTVANHCGPHTIGVLFSRMESELTP